MRSLEAFGFLCKKIVLLFLPLWISGYPQDLRFSKISVIFASFLLASQPFQLECLCLFLILRNSLFVSSIFPIYKSLFARDGLYRSLIFLLYSPFLWFFFVFYFCFDFIVLLDIDILILAILCLYPNSPYSLVLQMQSLWALLKMELDVLKCFLCGLNYLCFCMDSFLHLSKSIIFRLLIAYIWDLWSFIYLQELYTLRTHTCSPFTKTVIVPTSEAVSKSRGIC